VPDKILPEAQKFKESMVLNGGLEPLFFNLEKTDSSVLSALRFFPVTSSGFPATDTAL
jgi:hypothetical protein